MSTIEWALKKAACNMFPSLSTCGKQRNKSQTAFSCDHSVASIFSRLHIFQIYLLNDAVEKQCMSFNVPNCSIPPFANQSTMFRLKCNFTRYLLRMMWKICSSTQPLRLIDSQQSITWTTCTLYKANRKFIAWLFFICEATKIASTHRAFCPLTWTFSLLLHAHIMY